MRLYEIANEFKGLMQLAEDGELSPEAIADTLEALTCEFEEKAKALIIIKKQIEAQASAFKDEIDRMQNLKKLCEKQSDDIEEYLRVNMVAIKADKFDLGLFKVTLRKATQAVEVIDESKIPSQYWRVIPESKAVDKSLIATDLKAEKEIEGARLIDGKRALLIK